MKYLLLTVLLVSILVIIYFLSDKNTEEYFTSDKPVLTLYYAKWCGASKSFLPEWNNRIHHKLKVDTEMIECDEQPDRCKNIKYFPTLILKSKSGEKQLESSLRDYEGITRFVDNN